MNAKKLPFKEYTVEKHWPFDEESHHIFNHFKEKYSLTAEQAAQFIHYTSLLLTASQQFNLTAIDTPKNIFEYHFKDSLALADCYDLSGITMLADVGTGGGFPGVPLKIVFPHLKMVLIEVATKKIDFLNAVVEQLKLENIEVSSLDWRTFLRKTEYPIELFVSRASLHTDELMRMFQPSSPYKNALLVYWASRHWEGTAAEEKFFWKECEYVIEHKKRRLVFLRVK